MTNTLLFFCFICFLNFLLCFRVVVGAPLGNKTSRSNERNRFGSVYKCRSGAPSCEVIEIDDSGKWFNKHCDKIEKLGTVSVKNRNIQKTKRRGFDLLLTSITIQKWSWKKLTFSRGLTSWSESTDFEHRFSSWHLWERLKWSKRNVFGLSGLKMAAVWQEYNSKMHVMSFEKFCANRVSLNILT